MMISNRTNLLITLLIATLSGTPSNTHAAPSTAALRGTNFGLDLVRVVITNAAMTQHKDNPAAAARLHSIAAATGIASNLVRAKLVYDSKEILNGDILAVSSAMAANFIDLGIHLSNAKNATPYHEIETSKLIGIRSTQVLEVVANYFSHYGTADICKKTEFKTAMHNLHTSLEALEKILLAESYETTAINKQVLIIMLASSALLNVGSSGYYTIQAINKKLASTEQDYVDSRKRTNNEPTVCSMPDGYECPICLETKTTLGANPQIIIFPCCANKQSECLECCRTQYQGYAQAENTNTDPTDPTRTLRDPDLNQRRMFANGELSCPFCQTIVPVRHALHTHPAR